MRHYYVTLTVNYPDGSEFEHEVKGLVYEDEIMIRVNDHIDELRKIKGTDPSSVMIILVFEPSA